MCRNPMNLILYHDCASNRLSVLLYSDCIQKKRKVTILITAIYCHLCCDSYNLSMFASATAVAPNVPNVLGAAAANGSTGGAAHQTTGNEASTILVCVCSHTESAITFTLHKLHDTEGLDTKERKSSIQTAFLYPDYGWQALLSKI